MFAVKDTLTFPTLLVFDDTDPIVGACGTVEIVTEFDADVASESPFALTAFNLIVYVDPEVSPGIDKGLVVVAGDIAVYVVPSVDHL